MEPFLTPGSPGTALGLGAFVVNQAEQQQQQQQLPLPPSISGNAPASHHRLMRSGSMPRAGVSTGDVIAMLDPTTRQPYGVARVLLNPTAGANGATGCGAPGCGGGEPPPDGAGSCDCWAFVLALLDPSCPGFRSGSCWLEVFKQGEHIGLRSAAAGGRFLQARRRGGVTGSSANTASSAPERQEATGNGCSGMVGPSDAVAAPPTSRLPGAAALVGEGTPAVQQGLGFSEAGERDSTRSGLLGSSTSTTVGSVRQAAGEQGPSSVAGFARQLVRTSRLVFYGHNLGVYEQFELLPPGSDDSAPLRLLPGGSPSPPTSTDSLLSVPWRTIRVQLRSRLLPRVRLEVELVRIGELVAPRRAPSPPRRMVAAADGAAAEDERARLSRIEAVILEQWFKFVESEQQARIGVETAFGELVADVQELRTGTGQQIEWLRGQMAHEIARLMRRIGRREAIISELKDGMAAKMAWGVAVINRAAKARVLRSTLNAWSGYAALLAERRGTAAARSMWVQHRLIGSVVTAWRAAASAAATKRARGSAAEARLGRVRLKQFWAVWRKVAHRRSSLLLPSFAAAVTQRRGFALQRSALLAWRNAWEEETNRRFERGQQLERMRQRRLQRTAFSALSSFVCQRRSTRLVAVAAAAAVSTGLLRRTLHSWQDVCCRRAAAAQVAAGLLDRKGRVIKGQVLAAWAGRVAEHRATECAVEHARRTASKHLLQRAFLCWVNAAGVSEYEQNGRSAFGHRAPLAAGGSAEWAAELLARIRRSRGLRAAFNAWRSDALTAEHLVGASESVWRSKLLAAWRGVPKRRRVEEEGLKACLRRKRIAFRAFKSWYWDALDLDVRTMLQAALNTTGSDKPTLGQHGSAQLQPWCSWPAATHAGSGGAAATAVEAAAAVAGDKEAAALLSIAAGLLPGASKGGNGSWSAAAPAGQWQVGPQLMKGLVAEGVSAAMSEVTTTAADTECAGQFRAWPWSSSVGGGSTALSAGGATSAGGALPSGKPVLSTAGRRSASLPPPSLQPAGQSSGGHRVEEAREALVAAVDRGNDGRHGRLVRGSSSVGPSGGTAGAAAAVGGAPRTTARTSSSSAGLMTREGSVGASVLDRLTALSRRLGDG